MFTIKWLPNIFQARIIIPSRDSKSINKKGELLKRNEEGKHILDEYVILASKFMLRQLSINKIWFIDATYESCPKGFYQMLNILTYNKDIKNYIPSCHI